MTGPLQTLILESFSTVDDPRVERSRLHRLVDVLALALCATIAGADSVVEIERYGRLKESWLSSWLPLANGVPSHDTIGRVLRLVDPKQLGACLTALLGDVSKLLSGRVIPIDGKTLRGSSDPASDKRPVHMVSAYGSSLGLVLAQVATDEKSNEITAIPELLDLLDIQGATVTIDAMACQRNIAAKIIDKGADYVLGLKGNQSTMNDEVRALFASRAELANHGIEFFDYETIDGDHGRIETRRYVCTPSDEHSPAGRRLLRQGADSHPPAPPPRRASRDHPTWLLTAHRRPHPRLRP